PAGLVAVIAGWITTEVRQQPYTVYGVLTTAESVTPLEAPTVGASINSFIVVHFAVFHTGTGYIIKLISHEPYHGEPGPEAEPLPLRAAGITPAPAVDPDRTIGHADEEARP